VEGAQLPVEALLAVVEIAHATLLTAVEIAGPTLLAPGDPGGCTRERRVWEGRPAAVASVGVSMRRDTARGIAAACLVLWPVHAGAPARAAGARDPASASSAPAAEPEPADPAVGLRAGAAAVALELPEGVPLAGYGARGPWNASRGQTAPVEARALVLEALPNGPRLGLVALDVLIVTPALRAGAARRAEALGLDALVVAATHTHTGPGGYVDAWLPELAVMGFHTKGVAEALEQAAGAALAGAVRSLAPAALGTAIASSSALSRNRRREDGPIDASIPVLRVDAADGGAIATLFALAAHPTVLSPDDAELSPDYPGAARAAVEARRGGVAIFVAGPLGDQAPRLPGGEGWPDAAAARLRDVQELGGRLGALVAETAAAAEPRGADALAYAEVRFRLPPVAVRPVCAAFLLAPLLRAAARDALPREATLAALRAGPLLLLASPFELGVEVAGAIRERVQGPVLVAAHANDWLGYLLAPGDYDRGGYETCLSFYGRDLAPVLVAAAVEALRALALGSAAAQASPLTPPR
jgi:hypothetical protein